MTNRDSFKSSLIDKDIWLTIIKILLLLVNEMLSVLINLKNNFP